jgi:signal transduction histidine kinase
MLRDVRQWLARRLYSESPPPPPPAEPAADPLWPRLGQQFAPRLLASVYRLGSHLAEAEAAERDPDQLRRLFQIDQALTQLRRQTENLHVLTGVRIDDAGRPVTTLLDAIRGACSAIEQYHRVQVGHIADLAVTAHAAADVIRVLTELTDNATRYSPPATAVTTSAHLTEHGTVLLRIEDSGTGVEPSRLPALNAMLAGEAMPAAGAGPAADGTAQLGLAVVRRLAEIHGLRVSLTSRRTGGTTAAVLLPVQVLCEVPAPRRAAIADVPPGRALTPAPGPAPAPRRSLTTLPRRVPESLPDGGAPEPPRGPAPDSSRFADEIGAFADGLADAERARATTPPQGSR